MFQGKGQPNSRWHYLLSFSCHWQFAMPPSLELACLGKVSPSVQCLSELHIPNQLINWTYLFPFFISLPLTLHLFHILLGFSFLKLHKVSKVIGLSTWFVHKLATMSAILKTVKSLESRLCQPISTFK